MELVFFPETKVSSAGEARGAKKGRPAHGRASQTVDKPMECIEGPAGSSILIRRRRRVRRRGAAESRFLYQFLAVK